MNRILLFLLLFCYESIGNAQNTLFQYSLFNILAGGGFDGEMKVMDFMEKGKHWFNHIQFYEVKYNTIKTKQLALKYYL